MAEQKAGEQFSEAMLPFSLSDEHSRKVEVSSPSRDVLRRLARNKLAVAGMVAEEETMIENAECISDSFPGFIELMRRLAV